MHWRIDLRDGSVSEALLNPFLSRFLRSHHHTLQIMITAGGNQAFAMVALALLDPGDRVLLVRPAFPENQVPYVFPCLLVVPFY